MMASRMFSRSRGTIDRPDESPAGKLESPVGKVMFAKIACLWLVGVWFSPWGVFDSRCLAESPVAGAAAAPHPQMVVVCPTEFQQALGPLVDRRTADGISVRVLPSGRSAAEVLCQIVAVATPETTRYVLLIGDCALGQSDGGSDPRFEVPTLHRPATVTAQWGTTAKLPGDTFYGDFDGDGMPEAVVGRIPVDLPRQLSDYIHRVIAYETSTDFGAWRRRVQLTAGVGGFGFFADAAIESVTRGMVTSSLPASTRTHVTYASPSSPFNPGLEQFQDAVLGQYKRGARFWVYAGHGNVTELDRVPQTQAGRPVLSVNDLDRLKLDQPNPPIALMFACYTGAFDAREDCLAERMLLAEEGPIAVLAGSRVTLPYGNAAVASGLIRAVYEDRVERLGDGWLTALRELATDSRQSESLRQRRAVIDTLASLISPKAVDLPAERREHMQLYNLMGDPTLRLRHPETVPLDPLAKAAEGETISITGESPLAGELTLSLHRAIGSLPSGIADDQRYKAVNDTELVRTRIQIAEPGRFSAKLRLPALATGILHVVAHIKNADRFAVGDSRILVYAP